MAGETDTKEGMLLDISVQEASKLYKFYLNHERLIIGGACVILFLAIWEYVGGIAKLINPIFMSSPSRIAKTGYEMFHSGEIYNDMKVSGEELALGFGLSIVSAIPLGLLAGWYRKLNYALDPFLDALNATPRVALLPLIIIWVGIGIWSKVVIVYLGSFFPIIINTLAGVKTTDVRLLKAARSFRANDAQVFKTVIMPSTIPFIMSGLRQGLGRALVGVVVGELYAATAGVGFMITVAGATFQTDKVFVGIIIIAVAGVVLTKILAAFERRFDKWRPGFEGLT